MMWTLHEADCIAAMAALPARSVDVVIADPPYGYTANEWDSVIPLEPMWEGIARLIRPSGAIVLFSGQPFTSVLVSSRMGWYKYGWVWNKNNSAGFVVAKYRPFIVTEDINVFGVGGARVNYYPRMAFGERRQKGFAGSPSKNYEHYGTRSEGLKPTKGEVDNTYHPKNLLNISKVNKRESDHPTQKPVALMRYLVETYSQPGETVLDFCAGSGSTGVACLMAGRSFIGMENNPTYAAIARRRLAEAVTAPKQQALSWDDADEQHVTTGV